MIYNNKCFDIFRFLRREDFDKLKIQIMHQAEILSLWVRLILFELIKIQCLLAIRFLSTSLSLLST